MDIGKGGGMAQGSAPENFPYFEIPVLTGMLWGFIHICSTTPPPLETHTDV